MERLRAGFLSGTLQTELEGTVKLKDKQCGTNGKKHSCLNKQAERMIGQ